MPRPWKKQNAALLFPPLLEKEFVRKTHPFSHFPPAGRRSEFKRERTKKKTGRGEEIAAPRKVKGTSGILFPNHPVFRFATKQSKQETETGCS